MHIIKLNNPMVQVMRMLPALDALAESMEGFGVYTPHSALFHGRKYPAYRNVAAVDSVMPQFTSSLFKSALPEVCRYVKEKYRIALKLKTRVPELYGEWDKAKTLYHDNQWINPDIVTVYQREKGSAALTPSLFISIVRPLLHDYKIFNIVTGEAVSRIPGAINLCRPDPDLTDESLPDEVAMNRPEFPLEPPNLLPVMQVIAAARAVITNTLWASEIAVGYGVPVLVVKTQASAWSNAYDDPDLAAVDAMRDITPVVVGYKGNKCDLRETCRETRVCPYDGVPPCLREFNPEGAVRILRELL